MDYEKPEPRWRQWLTKEERKRVAEIDAAEGRMKAMTIERQLIANRALQRARYADKAKAAKSVVAAIKRRERQKP